MSLEGRTSRFHCGPGERSLSARLARPLSIGERPFTELTTAIRRRQWDQRPRPALIDPLPGKPPEGKLAGGESDEGGQGFRKLLKCPWARRRLRPNQDKVGSTTQRRCSYVHIAAHLTVSPATVNQDPAPPATTLWVRLLEDLGTAPLQLLLPSVRRNPQARRRLERSRPTLTEAITLSRGFVCFNAVAEITHQKRLHGH